MNGLTGTPVLRAALVAAAGTLLSACLSGPRERSLLAGPRAPAAQLAATPAVEQLSPMPLNLLRPVDSPENERRVSFAATNADVRRLIHLLAEAAGLSAVVSPDITGTVSVDFKNVTAREALQMLLEQSGIASPVSTLRPPWPPVVFYRIPVNIDQMSAAAIQTHFHVSREVAEMVVRLRQR